MVSKGEMWVFDTLVVGWPRRLQKYRQLYFNDALYV